MILLWMACVEEPAVETGEPPDSCTPLTLYRDVDGDGWGGDETLEACPTVGWTESTGDCDDADASVNPGAKEVPCDGLDSDCDGQDLEGPAFVDDQPYASAQQALDALGSGQTAWLCPGQHTASRTWSEPVSDLAIESVTGDPSTTRLVGQLTFEDADDVFISGIRWVDEPGPAVSYRGRGLLLAHAHFEGGGALSLDTDAEGRNRIWQSSFRDLGQPLVLGGEGESVLDEVEFRACTDTVVQVGPGPLVIEQSLFEDNALGERGLIDAGQECSSLTLTGNAFLGNSADRGTVLDLDRPEAGAPWTLDMEGNRVEDNEVRSGGGVLQLASASEGSVAVLRGAFLRNAAPGGGAVVVEGEGIELLLEEVDLGEGDDDNSDHDLDFRGEGYAWEGVVSVTCARGGACEQGP